MLWASLESKPKQALVGMVGSPFAGIHHVHQQCHARREEAEEKKAAIHSRRRLSLMGLYCPFSCPVGGRPIPLRRGAV